MADSRKPIGKRRFDYQEPPASAIRGKGMSKAADPVAEMTEMRARAMKFIDEHPCSVPAHCRHGFCRVNGYCDNPKFLAADFALSELRRLGSSGVPNYSKIAKELLHKVNHSPRFDRTNTEHLAGLLESYFPAGASGVDVRVERDDEDVHHVVVNGNRVWGFLSEENANELCNSLRKHIALPVALSQEPYSLNSVAGIAMRIKNHPDIPANVRVDITEQVLKLAGVMLPKGKDNG